MDDTELERRVHKHRLYFDNLVDLIPANIYIAKDDDLISWHHGMSKAERTAAKQSGKEHAKKAKQDRLDPDKFKSTVDLLQQRAKASLKLGNEKAEADANGKTQDQGRRAVTYEELRERLKKRIEFLRAKRNADAAAATARNARSWKNEKQRDSQKHKRLAAFAGSGTSTDAGIPMAKRPKQAPIEVEIGSLEKKSGLQSGETFEFGRVKMGLKDVNNRTQKRKKESKEKLLAKATKLHLEMEDPKTGQDKSAKHAWSAALSRSYGEKVYDDPGRLKQSLKREEHQRQRRSKKWEDRKETVKQFKDAKQRTRQEHVKERIQQKQEKKIAKREKKLLRPGFEGRREKFINE